MDDECAPVPSSPRSIPVRREEIRYAKDNDEWKKDEKDEGEEKSPMMALQEERRRPGKQRKKPRKRRATADSKVNRSAEADRQRRNRPRTLRLKAESLSIY